MTVPNAGKNVEKLVLIYCWWAGKRVQSLEKKLSIHLLHDPANAFLDIIPEKGKQVFTQKPVYDYS